MHFFKSMSGLEKKGESAESQGQGQGGGMASAISSGTTSGGIPMAVFVVSEGEVCTGPRGEV